MQEQNYVNTLKVEDFGKKTDGESLIVTGPEGAYKASLAANDIDEATVKKVNEHQKAYLTEAATVFKDIIVTDIPTDGDVKNAIMNINCNLGKYDKYTARFAAQNESHNPSTGEKIVKSGFTGKTSMSHTAPVKSSITAIKEELTALYVTK